MKLFIAFRVGDADYIAPADDILHLETFEGATPLPGAAPYVAGLVQVRGRLVPVVDVRTRFGITAPAAEGLDRRVIVVQHGARIAGLLVDRAREIIKLDPASFAPPPEIVAQLGFVTAIATQGSRLLLVVDVGHIIGATAPEQERTHA